MDESIKPHVRIYFINGKTKIFKHVWKVDQDDEKILYLNYDYQLTGATLYKNNIAGWERTAKEGEDD